MIDSVDVDGLVERVDVDALVQRVDVSALVDRVDLDAVLAKVDIQALLQRIDLNAMLAEVDLNAIMAGVDVQALAKRADIGRLVAESSQDVAGSALDLARRQVVTLDVVLTRVAHRLTARKDRDWPGPSPGLVVGACPGRVDLCVWTGRARHRGPHAGDDGGWPSGGGPRWLAAQGASGSGSS